jgi:hypothetical protein
MELHNGRVGDVLASPLVPTAQCMWAQTTRICMPCGVFPSDTLMHSIPITIRPQCRSSPLSSASLRIVWRVHRSRHHLRRLSSVIAHRERNAVTHERS